MPGALDNVYEEFVCQMPLTMCEKNICATALKPCFLKCDISQSNLSDCPLAVFWCG